MLYKKNQAKELDMELFRNPSAEYRGTPFWAWNCKLEQERLLRQIEYFKEMGFGGFHMHSRIGMSSPYLKEEFMGHIKACVQKAKSEGMLAWLYDEDRWASGAAGGYLTKDKKYRIKHLRLSLTRPAELLEKAEAFDAGKPYFLAAYDVVLDAESGNLKEYRRIGIDEDATGDKWYASVCTAGDDPWFNNQSYPDTMDEETMARFIEITYEAYAKAVGEEFDATIPSIFTDEPNFRCRVGTLPVRALGHEDIAVAWSRFFEEKYQVRYGEDLLDRLPELFWLMPDRRDTQIKYRYYDFCAELFARSFSDQCGKWCEEHGLGLTGHFLWEESLERQTLATGDNMRQYRSMTIPGIDILCDNVELTTAKQCQSVVHQMGREAMMAELYGVTNWDFDFKGHKFQGDWLAALGVTVRVPHLAWMSMGGEGKRDYPASIFYQSPWYKKYPFIEDHFARLNTALTRGHPEVRVGLIHPIESYWITTGPADRIGDAAATLDENFQTVTRWLLECHQDFHYINEALLPTMTDAKEPRRMGQMVYDVIVVPDCRTLRTTTLCYLEAFSAAGGKVLFVGDCPAYLDGVRSDEVKNLYERSAQIAFNQMALLEALEPYRLVDIRQLDGLPAKRLLYQLRTDGEDQWLFVAPFQKEPPATTDEQRGDDGRLRGKKLEITLDGVWQPQLYDTLSGKVLPIDFCHRNGKTAVQWERFPSDSLLLRFSAPHYERFQQKTQEKFILARKDFRRLVEVEREEENVLLLDQPEYRLDGGEWNAREEILRVDEQLRTRLDYPLRQRKLAQPWVMPEEAAEHTVSLRYEIQSEIKLKEVKLALEDAEKTEIFWNGKSISNGAVGWYVDEAIKTVALPGLKKGRNLLELRLPFARRTNLEPCYILGDFNVRVQGAEAWITSVENKMGFGSVTHQGLPFYGGNLTYLLPVEAPRDCNLEVHIGKFKGVHCTVSLDGGEEKPLTFAPSIASFRKVSKGAHLLRITLYGHRFNTFGCLHNCDEQYSYFGTNAWRTLGDRWSYEYQMKELGLMVSPQILFFE